MPTSEPKMVDLDHYKYIAWQNTAYHDLQANNESFIPKLPKSATYPVSFQNPVWVQCEPQLDGVVATCRP